MLPCWPHLVSLRDETAFFEANLPPQKGAKTHQNDAKPRNKAQILISALTGFDWVWQKEA